MARVEVVEIQKSLFPIFQRAENKRDKSVESGVIETPKDWANINLSEIGNLLVFGPSAQVAIDPNFLRTNSHIIESPPRNPQFVTHLISLKKVGDRITIVNRSARKVAKLTLVSEDKPHVS